jgi:dTDP-4-amino-4,6-dideoxygalactose transaminase
VGSSYLPSDMLAAFLLAQLEAKDQIQQKRRAIWELYHRELLHWAPSHGITLPTVPDGCEQSYHMYYLLFPSLEVRQRTIAQLKERGIHAVFHYQPLHLSEMGRRLGGKPGDCPVTESVSDRLLRLPFYSALSMDEQLRVIEALKAVA